MEFMEIEARKIMDECVRMFNGQEKPTLNLDLTDARQT
jgi:hypothetical protein